MTPSSEPLATRIGDRYRLDERIGAGAMGAVWRSTDELLNRTVAVKELLSAAEPPTAAGGDALEESRQRILREGRIGARLRHPHVISMFDVVVHDDRPWLVMEYLPSRSLAGVLSTSGVMPIAEVAAIGRQVADGLAAAHSAGVVHRDVKPGNVLIADDGLVKLTDFGVSRAVDEVQLTRTGLIAGTPAFLAPEVARGQEPTAASDIFALGATLYAAVEGMPPFGLDDNAYALLHRVATGAVTPPQRAGRLTPVIMRLLSPEPGDRPTAIEARDELEKVIDDRGPEPQPTMAAAAPARAPVPDGGTGTVSDLPSTAGSGEPGRDRNRSRFVAGRLLPAALVLLVLVGGIFAVVATRGSADPGGAPQAAPQAAPPAATSVAALPATAPATTAPVASTTPVPPPSPTPTPSSPPPAAGTDPVAFVQNYYALLPGNTEAAFALLGTQAQAASGGRAGFYGFYGGLQSVSLQNLRRTGDNTAEATVVFVRRDGRSSSEPYRFVMSTGPDSRTVMESFSRA